MKAWFVMFPQLPSNLDMLASAGVIDFDAESYIQGTPARYWGAPQQNLPLETPLPVMPYRGNTGYNGIPGQPPAVLPGQPTRDSFGPAKSKTSNWKKVLTGVTCALLLGAGLFKLKGGKLKQLPQQIKSYDYGAKFTQIKNKIVSFFTTKPPSTGTP